MRRSLLALTLLAAACGAPSSDPAGSSGEPADVAAPVVLEFDAAQLVGDRIEIDLDVTIARFLAPPEELPLERVELTADGQPAENLARSIYSCFDAHDEQLTNGDPFVVTRDDGALVAANGACLPCGLAFICPGLHEELGPGEKFRDDSVPTDLDPADDPTCGSGDGTDGTDGTTDGTSGGSSGSSGSSGSAGSGAGTGGNGGASGGAGNPGWD